MAGAGKRTFIAGEVLTAAQVNDFLMDQAVMRFSGSAARAASISAPTEGMVTYLDDTNRIEVYDGAAWQTVIDEGIVTTKGDILVASASNTLSVLGAGADGEFLSASSGASTGLVWKAVESGIPLFANVASFTTSASWAHPSATAGSPKDVLVVMIGGGGGGGAGAYRGRATVHISGGSTNAGGGGGAGGRAAFYLMRTLGETIDFTVGSGGTGGANFTGAGTNENDNGDPGVIGGTTSITSIPTLPSAVGGGGGSGGQTLGLPASGGAGSTYNGAGGASGSFDGSKVPDNGVAGESRTSFTLVPLTYVDGPFGMGGGGGGGSSAYTTASVYASSNGGAGGSGLNGDGGSGGNGASGVAPQIAGSGSSASAIGGGGGGGGATYNFGSPGGESGAGGNGSGGAVLFYYDL